jgi:hypothetical protein
LRGLPSAETHAGGPSVVHRVRVTEKRRTSHCVSPGNGVDQRAWEMRGTEIRYAQRPSAASMRALAMSVAPSRHFA